MLTSYDKKFHFQDPPLDCICYANMDYDKGHLMCRNVIEQNASLWFMGKAIHSRVNVDVAGSFYNGKLVSPGYTSCLLTLENRWLAIELAGLVVNWERQRQNEMKIVHVLDYDIFLCVYVIVSVDAAMVINYSNKLINGETINVSSNCLPVKATRFEPDGHCFHDVALKLVGFFMEEKVEDDDEINDSLPKDKEPDYMQSAFRFY
ncbi:hypothetical protein Tco_0558316 [Tanacetum coccineum]